VKPKKPGANERRLAKLLREMGEYAVTLPGDDYEGRWTHREMNALLAAFLARRGVLAVCAATVPDDFLLTRASQIVGRPADDLRDLLRRLARGAS